MAIKTNKKNSLVKGVKSTLARLIISLNSAIPFDVKKIVKTTPKNPIMIDAFVSQFVINPIIRSNMSFAVSISNIESKSFLSSCALDVKLNPSQYISALSSYIYFLQNSLIEDYYIKYIPNV